MQNFKQQKTFTIKNSNKTQIHVSVYLVYRGNFNDERLVESKTFCTDQLVGEPLVWFDCYLDKLPGNKKRLALVHLDDNDLYLLQDDGQEICVVKKESFSLYFSDDYDEKYIISTEIW